MEIVKRSHEELKLAKDLRSELQLMRLHEPPQIYHVTHDEEPERESPWTDCFYDLFLVVLMSKLVRFLLNKKPTDCYAVDAGGSCNRGDYDNSSSWHIPAVYAMLLAFWVAWRQLHVYLMHLHDGKTQGFTHHLFLAGQMVCMMFMCLFAFSLHACPSHTAVQCANYGVHGFDLSVLFSGALTMLWYLVAWVQRPSMDHQRFLLMLAVARVPMMLAAIIHLTCFQIQEPDSIFYAYFFGYFAESLLQLVIRNIPMVVASSVEELERSDQQFRLPVHVRYTRERYGCVVGIAFGESVLQLTGATSVENWEHDPEQMITAVGGFVLIYMLGLMYYHHPSLDLSLHQSLARWLWFEAHHLLILGLVCVGAGLEGSNVVNSTTKSQTLDGTEQYYLVMGVFSILALLHGFPLVHPSRCRAFRLFPLQAAGVFVVMSMGLSAGALGVLYMNTQKVAKQILALAVIVLVNCVWNVYLGARVFSLLTGLTTLQSPLSHVNHKSPSGSMSGSINHSSAAQVHNTDTGSDLKDHEASALPEIRFTVQV